VLSKHSLDVLILLSQNRHRTQDGIVIANEICNTIHSLRPTDGTKALLQEAKS